VEAEEAVEIEGAFLTPPRGGGTAIVGRSRR
jgi:hypothetical protein